jgi:preprotein translocase subunit SecA
MQTGEGKTLTAVFPAYLNALPKKGVHVLTFNDYLAKRDANWMRPVYEFLGMSVGYLQEGMQKSDKKAAYHADITYATAKEVGFDYLRSFIAYHPDELIMRPFHFAIVDEADALLIDEARNPLVLAGIMICSGIDFTQVAHFVSLLINNVDFGIDEYSRNIYLKDSGIEKVERTFAIKSLHDDKNLNLHAAINLAIHARMLLSRDIDYVVKNDEIKLVDEFNGRIVEDRKWRNGIQTAVEAIHACAARRDMPPARTLVRSAFHKSRSPRHRGRSDTTWGASP